MQEPSSTSVGTAKRKLLVIDVKRRRSRLREIGSNRYYDVRLSEYSEIARDVERAIALGVPGALRTGGEVIRAWRKREERLRVERAANTPTPTYSSTYTQPASRIRGPRCRTISLPRTRSREQSHAPRSSSRTTPKAAQRSGDSGDSSDPPGSEPAALAALLLYLLLGVDS